MLPQLVEHKTLLLALVITLQVSLSIFGGVVMAYSQDDNTIIQGVQINNVNIGGLTKEAAFAQLQNKLQKQLKHTNLNIRLDDKEWVWKIPFSSVGYNLEDAVEQAYQVGRQENFILRAFTNVEASKRKHLIKIEPIFDRNQLRFIVAKIAEEVYKPAQDARINLVSGKLVIIPEQTGVTMYVNENLELLAQGILSQTNQPVNLIKKVVPPKVVANDLKDIQDNISNFTTYFSLNKTNRVNNIKIAAKEINGVVIKPGETFSFNAKVGPRMQKYGYLEAPVISNNKLVSGIGGGVCQVSTTMYNAVIRAGLTVKERSPHSKPPGYVPIGQDAAVADNILDFKFVNTRKSSILIVAEIKDNQLLVRLFGKKEDLEPKISMISEEIKAVKPQVIVKNDSSLPIGVRNVMNPGEKGYTVKVYRVLYENGRVTQKEFLYQDYYKSSPTLIKLGTGTEM
jgi:vancomycin resistance protein YoaR